MEDLYLAADVLVTDYSSAMFDYAVLDRPIVVYAPDWEAYRVARGVYFDLMAEPPGAVAVDFPGLLDLFRSDAVRSTSRRAGPATVPGPVLHAGRRACRRAGGPPDLPGRTEPERLLAGYLTDRARRSRVNRSVTRSNMARLPDVLIR